MSKNIAQLVDVQEADNATSFQFNLTIMNQDLFNIVGDRTRDTYITIPNTVPYYSYEQYIVNDIVDDFDDLWPTYYVLPTDVVLIGFRETRGFGRENYTYEDDLYGESIVNGSIGKYAWRMGISGAAYIDSINVPQHPGVIRINATHTFDTGKVYMSGWQGLKYLSEMTWIVRGVNDLGVAGGPMHSMVARVGLMGNDTTGAYNQLYIEADSAGVGDPNPQWTLKQAPTAGSPVTSIATTLPFYAWHWYQFSWIRTSETELRFRGINLTLGVVEPSNIYLDITGESYPMEVAFYLDSNTSLYRGFEADYVRMVHGGNTRIG